MSWRSSGWVKGIDVLAQQVLNTGSAHSQGNSKGILRLSSDESDSDKIQCKQLNRANEESKYSML